MSLKLKALGLGLLAVLAMGAVAVMNAGANTTGHFTSSVHTTTLTGEESTSFPPEGHGHKIELGSTLSDRKIYCKNAKFHGHFTGTTTQSITITPEYSECTKTISNAAVTVTFNGCAYIFTSRTEGDATAGLECPVGKKVEVHDSETGCTFRFGSQEVPNAVTYVTDTAFNKHSITLTATATGINFTAHNGLCLFVATNRTDGTMTGAATVRGETPEGVPVDITAT